MTKRDARIEMIRQDKRKYFTILGAVFFALIGMMMRMAQLQFAFDEAGLPIRGSIRTYIMAAVCVAFLVVAFLVARTLEPRETCYNSLFLSPTSLGFSLSGSIIIGVGGLIIMGETAGLRTDLSIEGTGFTLINSLPTFLGVCTAVSILVNLYRTTCSKRPLVLLYLIPFAYVVFLLITQFKQTWSADPVILDYCFQLFALISCMCAIYHTGAYCFDRGKRRNTAFWCLISFFFCAVSLVGIPASQAVIYGGLGLWMLSIAEPILSNQIPAYVHPYDYVPPVEDPGEEDELEDEDTAPEDEADFPEP